MKTLCVLLVCLLLAPFCLAAQAGAPDLLPGNLNGRGGLSVPMQIVVLLTVLTLLPAAVMSITPFLRIVVVLHFLRQALGTQATPAARSVPYPFTLFFLHAIARRRTELRPLWLFPSFCEHRRLDRAGAVVCRLFR